MLRELDFMNFRISQKVKLTEPIKFVYRDGLMAAIAAGEVGRVHSVADDVVKVLFLAECIITADGTPSQSKVVNVSANLLESLGEVGGSGASIPTKVEVSLKLLGVIWARRDPK